MEEGPVIRSGIAQKGAFSFTDVPSGTYTMEVIAPCYVIHYHTVSITGGIENKYDKQLVLAPTFGDYDGQDNLRCRLPILASMFGFGLQLLNSVTITVTITELT